jgi:hypothetical protein
MAALVEGNRWLRLGHFETLGLIIARPGVKPSVVMKTLSGTFRFVVLGVIVTVVVVSCCDFPFIPAILSYCVEIGGKQKGPTYGPTYVEWKNKDAFDEALAQVRHNNGKICICVLLNSGGKPYRHPLNNDCPDYDCPSENIRTVKVTKSKAADNIAAAESAVNDPHVTYRVQSPYPGDISKVLNALKK